MRSLLTLIVLAGTSAAVAAPPSDTDGPRLSLEDQARSGDDVTSRITYELRDHQLTYDDGGSGTITISDDELAEIEKAVARDDLAQKVEHLSGGIARSVDCSFELGDKAGDVTVMGDTAQVERDPFYARIQDVRSTLRRILDTPHPLPPPAGPVEITLQVPGAGDPGRIEWTGPFPAVSEDGTRVAYLMSYEPCAAGADCFHESLILAPVGGGKATEISLSAHEVNDAPDDDLATLRPRVTQANARLARSRWVPMGTEDLGASAFAPRGPGLRYAYDPDSERLVVRDDGRKLLDRKLSLKTSCTGAGCIDYCGDGPEFLREAHADPKRRVLVVTIDNTSVPSPDHCSAHDARTFVLRLPRR